jgi:hypothetical protein
MLSASSPPGPASALLEQELAHEVRRQGIVVWLDRDASFTTFTEGLAARHAAGAFPYPVVGFKGSFLELLFALEAHGSGYEKNALLIHMPGFNEDQIRGTPMLELYTAGTRFRKALDTLIRQAATGRVAPDQVDHFVAGKPTLEQADTWLTEAVSRPSGGLAMLLEASGRTLVVEALAQVDSILGRQVTSEADAKVLRSYLHNLTGIDDDWFAFAEVGSGRTPIEQALYALGAWLLCVEYVHDLRREAHLPVLRRLKALSPALVKVNARIVGELRDQHGEAYAQRADDVEALVHEELDAMTPEDLGHIDTFREEENRVLGGAVDALKSQDWAKALVWCNVREGAKSFWINRDRVRRRAWDLVAEAARFGTVLAAHPRPFDKITSHEDAVTRYADGAFRVDRAHRRFEQERARRLDPQLPHFGALQEVVGILRKLHRTWADELSRDYARVCRNSGFLPPAGLRQRSLYDQVVQPMAQAGEKVAVFLVDAFRYEMATELLEELRAAGGSAVVDLKPRLAELPTITSVGMNALAPVAQGDRLTVAGAGDSFKGFRAGEYTVKTPGDRSRAMGMRTSGRPGLLIDLADLCDRTPETLKKLKDHTVVVVHSTEIDDAGEANLGVHTFEATLRQLRAAWHHLQGAGIKHAVFTADHGFLLQDETTAIRAYGKKTDPQRRYVVDPYERSEDGMFPVAFSALGYEGMSGFLLLRDDTALFATGVPGATFVHGGNSPQERIIPVLTVSRKRVEASGYSEYAVEAEAMPDAFGFHRVRLRITQTGLAFVGPRSIALDLRVPGRAEVRAIVKEVSGAGTLKAGRIEAPVKEDWTDVFFALEGPIDERAPVELYHGDAIEKVRPCTVDKLFGVTGTQIRGTAPVSVQASGSSAWALAIEDQAVRAIFLHIEKHRSVTEAEIITMLGSPRAARRFALTFDENVAKLPFRVASEANASGKRYIREEDK